MATTAKHNPNIDTKWAFEDMIKDGLPVPPPASHVEYV